MFRVHGFRITYYPNTARTQVRNAACLNGIWMLIVVHFRCCSRLCDLFSCPVTMNQYVQRCGHTEHAHLKLERTPQRGNPKALPLEAHHGAQVVLREAGPPLPGRLRGEWLHLWRAGAKGLGHSGRESKGTAYRLMIMVGVVVMIDQYSPSRW